ncbi:hypothetical protein NKJ70_05890 [Mesorhizobium sp. M0092]|uniref:hypothetical protein n=1 Tax=Mesorhizobium sp. M0092 TaxID=2956876 RepID=UPI00333C3F00
MDQAKNLRKFFSKGENSVTRERIFFNRLSFDLKIAAARAGHHLHLYEPDVDRDGFDIVVEDEEGVGWYQTKAALSSAGTANWSTSVGFLRPAISCADQYGFDPVEAGRGGGVILIEIADKGSDGAVTYRYTDFDILAAIERGYLTERPYKGRGKPAKSARDEAAEVIAHLRAGERKASVALSKKLFITVRTSDDLLNVMGRQSEQGYGMFATRNAYSGFAIGVDGESKPNDPIEFVSLVHYHMTMLCDVQPTAGGTKVTRFDPFGWPRPSNPTA